MYIPPANRIDDPQKAVDFIHAHGFATVVTEKDGVPWASHLPVLLDETIASQGHLRSHMARANEQWKHFDDSKEVLCIFHGPHSYISPSWYVSKVAVPTWNYATVHVYGIPKIEEDSVFLRKVVDDTTEKYEKSMDQPWKFNLPEEMIGSLMKAIVGFSIRITRIEAKFKLGQNRSAEDQRSMLAALDNAAGYDARTLSDFIKSQK
jgi:transcriptional regulator